MRSKKIPAVVWYVAAVVFGVLVSLALRFWFKAALLWVAVGFFVVFIALLCFDTTKIQTAVKAKQPKLATWWAEWKETWKINVVCIFMGFVMSLSFIFFMSTLPKNVTKTAYVEADEYHVIEAYLDGEITENSFDNQEWLDVYFYLEGNRLTDEQLAVITYYGMWCGSDFKRTAVARKLFEGEKIQSSDFALEGDSGHKIWLLRAVWDGKISLRELKGWPHGTVYLRDINGLNYDSKGRPVITRYLRKRLRVGLLTAEEILEYPVVFIKVMDTSPEQNEEAPEEE